MSEQQHNSTRPAIAEPTSLHAELDIPVEAPKVNGLALLARFNADEVEAIAQAIYADAHTQWCFMVLGRNRANAAIRERAITDLRTAIMAAIR